MCGIAGFLELDSRENKSDLSEKFAKSLVHRGPDQTGIHIFNFGFFVNTRLSIIDISGGGQPFYSEDRKVAVIQNGEIFNFIEIRNDLQKKGVLFKSQSDTEVILRAYEYYGDAFVHHLNGMFAIAIIDERKSCLILIRDRLGVKPLYFHKGPDGFAFSSEIKTFNELKNFKPLVNPTSIYHFLNLNFVPPPETIYQGVYHVRPGTMLKVDIKDLSESELTYWDIENSKEIIGTSEQDLLEELRYILEDAIRIRLRSDVPIGAFLSGGLDSSLVCALAKKKFNYAFETYTIGFREAAFDEAGFALKVAEYLNLKNNTTYMSHESLSIWKKITWFNDQPHGDISFIPTFMVSEQASRKYKVVFSGDGGDEAFGGYLKYLSLVDKNELGTNYFSSISLFDESVFNYSDLYTPTFMNGINKGASFQIFSDHQKSFSEKDLINQAILFDVKFLLPGNNLVKPDRMAMANSLEVRSPLLDYRIYELMFKQSGKLKVSKELGTKHLLKKLALNFLPEELVYRKKQMFTVPVGEWFKNELIEVLIENLTDPRFLGLEIFNKSYLSNLVHEHCSGKSNHTRQLRAILNLKLWFDSCIFGKV